MFLIPIGRDEAEIRRHAWISYVIIALNVLGFVMVMGAERESRTAALNADFRNALVYLDRRPYLQTPPSLEEILSNQFVYYFRRQHASAVVPPGTNVAREQRTMNQLAAKAVDAYRQMPRVRFGYVPAAGGLTPLITSMFIHAGLLHLIGNLLFFFLSGPFVEDVFGRPLFTFLYVTGGIAASLTYAVQHPTGTIPLVGASGAIAAVMGAYLVRFLKSKVEFLFISFFFRPVRFFLPAFVVLPLWFLQQLFEMQTEGGSSVAFSAHVGGFVYGFAIALIVKLMSFEEKFVNPVVEKETTWQMDERIARAIAEGEPGAYDAYVTAQLNRHIAEKQNDLAADLIRDVTADPGAVLPKFLPRAASFAERSGDREWALSLYERMYDADPDAPAAVGSLVKIGTLLRLRGDTTAAREAFAKARAHPACTAEWAPTIDAKIAQLSS